MKRKNYYGPECAKRLDSLMTELDIKAPALADLSHYSSQQIRNFRNFRRPMTIEAAHSIAPILGVRPEYLLCEDDCKTSEELKRFNERKFTSKMNNLTIDTEISKIAWLTVRDIENNNEDYYISAEDHREFREDIANYIEMRTEKWLMSRLKKKGPEE